MPDFTKELVLCIRSVESPDVNNMLIAHKGKIYTKIRYCKCAECSVEVIEIEEIKHDFRMCNLGPNFLPALHFVPLNKPGSIPEDERVDLLAPSENVAA